MKIARSSNNKKNIIIIAATVVVILIAIGVVIFAINGAKGNNQDGIFAPGATTTTTRPKTVLGINISIYPKMEYSVGEVFDPTGIKVQVITNYSDGYYFVDASELKFSGFDSSEPNDALPVTVTYKGYTAQLNVKIKERVEPKPDPVVVGIKLSEDFKTEYTLQEWNDNEGPYLRSPKIVLIYDDGSEKPVTVNVALYCSGIQEHLDAPGETSFKLSYQGFETIITVTITE